LWIVLAVRTIGGIFGPERRYQNFVVPRLYLSTSRQFLPVTFERITPMRVFRFLAAALFAFALASFPGAAFAQAVKQVQLTDKQIENYIASQKEMSALIQKMQGGAADKPDPKVEGQLEATAKKYGFANMAEYDSVADNISLLMSCIDPKTKAFSEPKVALQRQIDQITANKSIPEVQKKEMLGDLSEQLKAAEPIKFASNIELVKKYYDKLDAAMQ
jgi:cell division protein FtsB